MSATPRFQCNDFGCGALIGYDYTGDGTCSSGCVGYPTDPMRVTLTFSVTRTVPPSPCKMKSGTGTWDASYPSSCAGGTTAARVSFITG